MRLAICNWTHRQVGGTESYLGRVAGYLDRHGYEIGFLSERDTPANRPPIQLPHGTPLWCVEKLGEEQALSALRAWKPDVIHTNIIEDVRLDQKLLEVAPTVFDAHAFYGTCVGGNKCFKRPQPMPCARQLGWQCLVNYYPRRCGGLNPITMLMRYRHEMAKHALLPRYQAVIVHSEYMRNEYVKHGVLPGRAFTVSASAQEQVAEATPTTSERLNTSTDARSTVSLLFVGRMDDLKGGSVLLEALPAIAAGLGRAVHLAFAGEGPARSRWERQARSLADSHASISAAFHGWIRGDALAALYRKASVLVVPSLWPEPFGLVGLEAGHYGVPSAAFAVGGIPDWLIDGVNGHLAPGDPPTAQGLAQAVIECLIDSTHTASLRAGAEVRARSGGNGGSWSDLLDIFENVGA